MFSDYSNSPDVCSKVALIGSLYVITQVSVYFSSTLVGPSDESFSFGIIDLIPLTCLTSTFQLIIACKCQKLRIYNFNLFGESWSDLSVAAVLSSFNWYSTCLYALIKSVAHYVMEDPRESRLSKKDM